MEKILIMLKKINTKIEKLEQQKNKKTEQKINLETEINLLNTQLKELKLLKNQYEKLIQDTDKVFSKMNDRGEYSEKV